VEKVIPGAKGSATSDAHQGFQLGKIIRFDDVHEVPAIGVFIRVEVVKDKDPGWSGL
jgi:hypothetical protein